MAILRLVPTPRHPEVIHRRRKPAAQQEDFGTLATLKSPDDWRRFSQAIFGDNRMWPEEPKRVGNVIPLPLPGRRSTSQEIEQVRQEEIRRGKRR